MTELIFEFGNNDFNNKSIEKLNSNFITDYIIEISNLIFDLKSQCIEKNYFDVVKFLNYLLNFTNHILSLINEIETILNENSSLNNTNYFINKLKNYLSNLFFNLDNINFLNQNNKLEIIRFKKMIVDLFQNIITNCDYNSDFTTTISPYSNIKLTWTYIKIKIIELQKIKQNEYKQYLESKKSINLLMFKKKEYLTFEDKKTILNENINNTVKNNNENNFKIIIGAITTTVFISILVYFNTK